MNGSNKFRALWPLGTVVLVAALVNLPCLLWGLQFGHDHNIHITYLHFFDTQLRSGELYPRWISGLNFGAGSPIFFIQYPLPYYAAAALEWMFPIAATPVGDAHALGFFVFITGILSGVFTWLWCRSLANPVAAAWAAVACLTMPYIYGCDVYYRAAIGEYSALAWVPLGLFWAHQIDVRPVRAVAGVATAFAMILFSHLFTAVLFAPFLILYAASRVNRVRVPATIFLVGCALLLGGCISGLYFLPMNVHRSFFSMANLIRLGPDNFFSYQAHLFPFGPSLFPASHSRLRFIGLISAGFGCTIVGVFGFRWRRTAGSSKAKMFVGVAVLCVVLTCAAPLLYLAGFLPHPEVANPIVIDVRGRIFLATFLTLDVALLAFACLRSYVERLPQFLLAASMACYFLTTRWSEMIWQRAPFLWNIQFPWRFSGMLSIFTVGLLAFALRDLWDSPRRQRLLYACAALWLVVAVAGIFSLDIDKNLTRPFFTELKSRVETPYFAYANVTRAPGPDELGPNDGFAGRVSFLAGDGTARLETITSRHLRLIADCVQPCTLLLKLVYYPFWRAYEASGHSIALHVSERAGLTELSLAPGLNEVNLELPFGRSEIWGAWLSFISLSIVIALFLRSRSRKAATSSAEDKPQERDSLPIWQ